MQSCTIEGFHKNSNRMTAAVLSRLLPCNRQQMTHPRRLGCFVLALAARQTDSPHWPDVGLFRYFIFANRRRARDNRAGACVARVNREVKVLFFQGASQRTKNRDVYRTIASLDADFWSVLLGSPIGRR